MLIGTLPEPITSAPLVILIYVVLIVMVASALASVLLRDILYSVGAFAATMVMIALLYLTIAPFLLFAIQLLVFTTISAALLIGMLRLTTGVEPVTAGPFSREWIVGAALAAVVLAIVAVVVGATSWPVGFVGNIVGFGATLTNTYVVGLATVIVLLASSALGAGLLVLASTLPSRRGGGRETRSSSKGEGRRSVR